VGAQGDNAGLRGRRAQRPWGGRALGCQAWGSGQYPELPWRKGAAGALEGGPACPEGSRGPHQGLHEVPFVPSSRFNHFTLIHDRA